jgi:hypothetical protein
MLRLFTHIREASFSDTQTTFLRYNLGRRPLAVLWLVFSVAVWWHLIVLSFFSDQSLSCDLDHFFGLDRNVFLEYGSRKKIVFDQSPNVYLHCQKGETKRSSLQSHQHHISPVLLLAVFAGVPLQKNPYNREA